MCEQLGCCVCMCTHSESVHMQPMGDSSSMKIDIMHTSWLDLSLSLSLNLTRFWLWFFGFPLSISSILFSICVIGLRYLGYTAIWLGCLLLFDFDVDASSFVFFIRFPLIPGERTAKCKEREKDRKKCYSDNVVCASVSAIARALMSKSQYKHAPNVMRIYCKFFLSAHCVFVCLFVEMKRKRIEFITSVQYFDSKCMFHKMVNGFAHFFFLPLSYFLKWSCKNKTHTQNAIEIDTQAEMSVWRCTFQMQFVGWPRSCSFQANAISSFHPVRNSNCANRFLFLHQYTRMQFMAQHDRFDQCSPGFVFFFSSSMMFCTKFNWNIWIAINSLLLSIYSGMTKTHFFFDSFDNDDDEGRIYSLGLFSHVSSVVWS